jgi:DHA1 family inner membrane transport protein
MRLRFQLLIVMVLRTVFNTMHRMVYPFLGTFARGLGVDITALSFALTARSLIGGFVPFVASVADQRGRRFGMLAGIALFTLGVALAAVWPSLLALTIALVLALLGKYMFDPAMQAYFGDRVPYQQRGLALAVTEFSWSLSFILGVPAMGFLIARYGWSVPFPVLTVLGLGMFATIWWMAPRRDANHVPARNPWANFGVVLRNSPALIAISIAFWASAANELVNLIFGVWLEDSFGLQIAALAGASAVIGLSELSGESLVAALTDRLGKARALALGLSANAAAAILLPIIGRTEVGALVGLFLFYISFEYMIVSHIPIMTEMAPGARATVMSFNLTGHSLGRALGAFLAPILYGFGFEVVTAGVVVFNMIGLFALSRIWRKI